MNSSPVRRLRLVKTGDIISGTDSDVHRGVMIMRVNRQLYDSELGNYLSTLRASGSPLTTQRLRRGHLERAFSFIDKPPFTITLDDLIGYMAQNDDWAANTRKSVRTSLRSFFAWAELTDRMPDDVSRRLPTVSVAQGKPRPAPTEIFDNAMARAGDRERVMLMCAAYAGLRRSEIARLHCRDVMTDYLRITGKGGKIREIPLQADLAAAITVRMLTYTGFVFPGQDHGHLSPQWVGDLLHDLLGRGWGGHTLRHRFATRAYASERDILTVQELLGHSSVATTQIYTQAPKEALRRAIDNVA